MGKLKSMSTTKKVLGGFGALILLFGIIGAATEPKGSTKELIQPASVKSASTTQQSEIAEPKIEEKTIEEIAVIPFQSTTTNDSTLGTGLTAIAVAGVNGEKILTYKVTYEDGVEVDRELSSERISRQPINEIKKVGTKVAAAAQPASTNCDSHYSGACVPIASDVDCAGGRGNGPAYVQGPVTVIGADIYNLDADNDGIGCES